jgi:S-layer homology domain
MSFTDVNPNDWFYGYVEYVYCHGVVSGYNTNPPCNTGIPCFRPNDNTTRGQLAKIVVLAFEFPIDTTGGPHFSDVPVGHTFYMYVETAYNLGLISGYADGTYKPGNNVTRGQIAKIVVNAAIMADPVSWTLEDPPTNTFEDVPVGSTFFRYVETAASHNLVSGYPCGTGPARPCVPPGNKPYYLPGDNATRAQISKITFLAVTYPPQR